MASTSFTNAPTISPQGSIMSGIRTYFSPTPKIKEAAHYVLLNLLNWVDAFPGIASGPSTFSSRINEEDILYRLNIKPKNVACYVLDKTLYSVIKHARSTGKEGIIIYIYIAIEGRKRKKKE